MSMLVGVMLYKESESKLDRDQLTRHSAASQPRHDPRQVVNRDAPLQGELMPA